MPIIFHFLPLPFIITAEDKELPPSPHARHFRRHAAWLKMRHRHYLLRFQPDAPLRHFAVISHYFLPLVADYSPSATSSRFLSVSSSRRASLVRQRCHFIDAADSRRYMPIFTISRHPHHHQIPSRHKIGCQFEFHHVSHTIFTGRSAIFS